MTFPGCSASDHCRILVVELADWRMVAQSLGSQRLVGSDMALHWALRTVNHLDVFCCLMHLPDMLLYSMKSLDDLSTSDGGWGIRIIPLPLVSSIQLLVMVAHHWIWDQWTIGDWQLKRLGAEI